MKNLFLTAAVLAISFLTFSCSVEDIAEGPMDSSRITNPNFDQEIIATPIDSTMMNTGDPFGGEPDIIRPPRK